jgi:hypothetical protein
MSSSTYMLVNVPAMLLGRPRQIEREREKDAMRGVKNSQDRIETQESQ